MSDFFAPPNFCQDHKCICCQSRIVHGLVAHASCTQPAEQTCYNCADSEGEGGYCWFCNYEGR